MCDSPIAHAALIETLTETNTCRVDSVTFPRVAILSLDSLVSQRVCSGNYHVEMIRQCKPKMSEDVFYKHILFIVAR